MKPNAISKRRELLRHDYEMTRTTNNDYVYWFDGMVIAESESFADATHEAWAHYEANKFIEEDTASIQTPIRPLAELHAEIASLQADLAAAQAIIIEAGKKVAGLEAKNEDLKRAIQSAASDIGNTVENVNPLKRDTFRAIASRLRGALSLQSGNSEAAKPANEPRVLIESGNVAVAPKFSKGDTVLNTDTGNIMTVRKAEWSEGAYWYELDYDDGSESYFTYAEDELEAQS